MQYAFDEFVLDTENFELRQHDQALKVEPQVVELIALLVKNAERLISKEEIFAEVWAGRYVSEAALSSRIKSARQALGDDGQTQRYIKTIHKKGFRFVGTITTLDSAAKDIPVIGMDYKRRASDLSATTDDHGWRPGIVVLPFTSLSNEHDQEYFADAITTDIMTMLSKHRWLNVVARNTSFALKGKVVNIQTLSKDLAANYVIEGSVQKADKRVRVNVHLIDTSSGKQIWAEKYDRDINDIFALQDEITEKIVGRLEPEIGLAERQKVIMTRPTNMQAWDCFHLGLYHLYKFTEKDNIQAQNLFLGSQQLDDNFADAFAWWAYAVVLGMVYWHTPHSKTLLAQALAACDKALSVDSQNATFYALRARVQLARGEYVSAITENEMAIALNPTFAVAYCSMGDSLAYEKRYEEAVVCFEKAIAMSPNDPQLWAFLTYGALALLFKQDYSGALHWCERAQSIPNCQYWTQSHKAVALAYLGRFQEAQYTAENLLLMMPEFTCHFAKDKFFYLKSQSQVDQYLEGLRLAGIPE